MSVHDAVDGSSTGIAMAKLRCYFGSGHVWYWLKADIQRPVIEVRFASNSRHSGVEKKSGHETGVSMHPCSGLCSLQHPHRPQYPPPYRIAVQVALLRNRAR